MLEEFNLKGKVETVTYEYEDRSHKLYFDENGMLVRQENNYSWEGIRGEAYDNYLYENGKLQSFDVYRVFAEIPTLFLGKFEFEYDSRNLLISSDSYLYEDKTTYKYDRKGNRIERYGYLKTRQKFNEKGQVREEWFFEDKETEVRHFGVTDAWGISLPDEIEVIPPHELKPIQYEHNEHGDVVSMTDTRDSQPVAYTVDLRYDDMGNWIERTSEGYSNHYLTAEDIYTRGFPYSREYIRRIITYYE